jgi:energy-converting hydrogenase Eha subunit G
MKGFLRKVFVVLVSVGLCVSLMALPTIASDKNQARAELIIAQYIEQKGFNLKPGTQEYLRIY